VYRIPPILVGFVSLHKVKRTVVAYWLALHSQEDFLFKKTSKREHQMQPVASLPGRWNESDKTMEQEDGKINMEIGEKQDNKITTPTPYCQKCLPERKVIKAERGTRGRKGNYSSRCVHVRGGG
jgi:hypothetical protein